jgi:hypothetical protein
MKKVNMKTIKELDKLACDTPEEIMFFDGYYEGLKDVLGLIDETMFCSKFATRTIIHEFMDELKKRITG